MTILKKQTFGRYDVAGKVKGLSVDSIKLDEKGKNNINWLMNVLNVRLADDDGNSFFMNVRDGYDIAKGKTLYLRNQDNEQLKVPFGDRLNDAVIQQVDDKSFIKVGYDIKKLKKDDGSEYNGWIYKKFLTEYDVVRYLKEVLQEDMKVSFSGNMQYHIYNGETQISYTIQRVYIEPKELPEGWTPRECGFNFTQTVLLDEKSIMDEDFDITGVAHVNAYIYTLANQKDDNGKIIKTKNEEGNEVNAKIPKVFPISYVIRTSEEKRAGARTIIDSFYKPTAGTVRKITIIGKFVNGYVNGNISEEDLSDDIKKLIEIGYYSMEDIRKQSSSKETIQEFQIIKPDIAVVDGQLRVDMDDKTYTSEDLTYLADIEQEVAVQPSGNAENVVSGDLADILNSL